MTCLSTEYYQTFLSQAVVSLIGLGAVFHAAMSSTATWFKEKRGIALVIVNSGSSLAGVVLPAMVDHLLRLIRS